MARPERGRDIGNVPGGRGMFRAFPAGERIKEHPAIALKVADGAQAKGAGQRPVDVDASRKTAGQPAVSVPKP
jgi:hypothetical protein